MGRSIGAVALGFLYVLAAIWLTQLVLWFELPGEPRDDGTEVAPEARLILTVICTFAAAAVGGFTTAHLVGRRELNHALALATVLVAILALTAGVIQTDDPSWYRLALPAAPLPGTLLGACLRMWLRAPSPPAPPKAD